MILKDKEIIDKLLNIERKIDLLIMLKKNEKIKGGNKNV